MKKLKFDPLNMIICGIGVQGNVLASEIVSSTLNDMGYRVAVGETYGASQRGGSVMSHVRVSETEDFGVLIPSGEAHIIIGFEPLETLRMARQYANKETMIIYDPRPVYPLGVLQGNQAYPPVEEISKELLALARETHAVHAADIAMEVGDSRAANIVLLGAFSRLPGSPLNTGELSEILAQRFQGEALEINRKAFASGCSAMDLKGGNHQ